MGRTLVWVALGVVALMIVGMVVVSVFGTVLKLAFYLLVGAVVVGGGMYVAGKVRAAVRGGRFRQIR